MLGPDLAKPSDDGNGGGGSSTGGALRACLGVAQDLTREVRDLTPNPWLPISRGLTGP